MKTIVNKNLITSYMNNNKMSKTLFCKKCGISLYVLNKIMTNPEGMRIPPFIKIAKTINVKLSDLLNF
ncbi:MAG: helix-turn-helix domain-containing protein [Clostridia bacterium]|nr:helix-turn-helix domain-containing protein [Clostridia bacterium]